MVKVLLFTDPITLKKSIAEYDAGTVFRGGGISSGRGPQYLQSRLTEFRKWSTPDSGGAYDIANLPEGSYVNGYGRRVDVNSEGIVHIHPVNMSRLERA